jgi:hypothetical protein
MKLTIPPFERKHRHPDESDIFAGSTDAPSWTLVPQFQAWIDRTKARILAEFRLGFEPYSHLIEQAVNDALVVAWQTGFPQLFFPELGAEAARKTVAQLTRLVRQQPRREHRLLSPAHRAFDLADAIPSAA